MIMGLLSKIFKTKKSIIKYNEVNPEILIQEVINENISKVKALLDDGIDVNAGIDGGGTGYGNQIKEKRMENYEKCSICKKSVISTDATKMTPRQLAGMQIVGSDVSAGSLVSMSISIITYDNPPDSANRPMWWVCKHCQSSRLSQGEYQENINLSLTYKQLLENKS